MKNNTMGKVSKLIHIDEETDLIAICGYEEKIPGMSMNNEYKEEYSKSPVKKYLTRIKFTRQVKVLTPSAFEILSKAILEETKEETFISREVWESEHYDRFDC